MIKAPKPNNSKLWRDSYYHKLFGFKAALEAERVLKFFEKERPNDRRPRNAITSYAAHAAGQAAGTWHVPTHALGAFGYAGRAIMASKKK